MRLKHLVALLLALFAAGTANAACQTTTGSGLAFASSSSYAVRSATVPQTSGSAGFSCNGSVITVASSDYARASVTSANGFRLIGPTGDPVPYTVSADPGGTVSLTQGATVNYFDPSLISLLGILSGGSFTPKIYGQLAAGANVAAGTYVDTLTIQWQWTVCHGVNAAGVCVLGESGSGTATVTVTLVVSKDCRVSAPAVDFGSAPLASRFGNVAQAVAVDCTKDAAFSVSFTSGSAGTARPWRTMTDGAGHVLQYNLYRPDGTTIWDETNPLAGVKPGTGALAPTLTQAYVARVNPAQVTPPAGRYQDLVSVVVSF